MAGAEASITSGVTKLRVGASAAQRACEVSLGKELDLSVLVTPPGYLASRSQAAHPCNLPAGTWPRVSAQYCPY